MPKVLVKKSDDGTYGDYQSTVNEEGFYRIGNTKPEDGGYRLFFTTPTGEQRSGLCNGYEICRALHSYLEWWLLEYQVCRVCAVADVSRRIFDGKIDRVAMFGSTLISRNGDGNVRDSGGISVGDTPDVSSFTAERYR